MEKELKDRLNDKIMATGIKKKKLAEDMGLSKAQFSQILSGRRNITDSERLFINNFLSK